jgi:hypothetical protein
MRVLADRHHGGLYHSFQRLFERRLGWELYTPRGHEWWDEGYWRFGEVYGDDRLAQQYLSNWTGPTSHDEEFPDDPVHGVALAEAKAMTWDVVLATVQENQSGFARFARETGARYALSVGNTNQGIDWSLDPLALISSEMPLAGRGILVAQEFDADGIFGFSPVGDPYRIASFVNAMPLLPCWPQLDHARSALEGFDVRVYGISGPDGNIKPIERIAALMAAGGWGWHDKVTGDGFGHVINYWAASGRPLIGHAAHYRGQRSERLWEDGVTCVDLGVRSLPDALAMVRDISAEPERHAAMGRAIRERFDELVDFDADARNIAALLTERAEVAA